MSWPSTRTMSLATNISQKGVQRALNCLVAHGLIAVESGKQFGRPNHYRVTLPPEYIDEWYEKHKSYQQLGRRVRPKVGQHEQAGRTNGAAGLDTVTHIKETSMNNKNSQEKVSSSVSSTEPCSQLTNADATLAMNQAKSKRRSVPKQEAINVCYELGMSPDEGAKFWRYNQPKGWPLLETMTLLDIAKTWRDRLLKECSSAIADERKRRETEKFERECREAEKRRERGEF